jgi:hypothetical protein
VDEDQASKQQVRLVAALLAAVTLAAALLAAVTLAAACATTIPGSAQPVPGQAPVTRAADPCTLLTAAQAGSLGAAPKGVFQQADPARRLPPSCV